MIILFIISLLASVVGAICGIGGGVIIKPLVDALNIIPVSEISFLSGCTVLSMSVISTFKGRKDKNVKVDTKKSILLAFGAIIGGILGKAVFQSFKSHFEAENTVGLIQSLLLFVVLVMTIIYVFYKKNIVKRSIENKAVIVSIGVVLGFLSSFLGIGGGPFNLVVFEYFFSMNTKESAKNSIYIIMFSQLAALIQLIILRKVPDTNMIYAVSMVLGGVVGGYAGSSISKKMSNDLVERLFLFLLIFIIGISLYNIRRFI